MNSKKATLISTNNNLYSHSSQGLDSFSDSCPASPVIRSKFNLFRPMNDYADIPTFDLDDDFYFDLTEQNIQDDLENLSFSGLGIGQMMAQKSIRKDSDTGVLD